MTTTRFTAAERRKLAAQNKHPDSYFHNARYRHQNARGALVEPALGTLDERLSIIIRRLGGTVGKIKVSDAERRWLQELGWAA